MTRAAQVRNLFGPLLRLALRVRVVGAHRVPPQGGLILISSRTGLVDASIIRTSLIRPVTVLARVDGQSNDAVSGRAHDDRLALFRWACVQVNRGEAIAGFPADELRPSQQHVLGLLPAYVSACTDMPVIPLYIHGARGRRATDPPRPRSEVTVLVGNPVTWDVVEDPGSRLQILGRVEQLRQVQADHDREALARLGIAHS